VDIAMAEPDPELLPIQRPRCPKCSMRMITAAVVPSSTGFEDRTFECMKCNHTVAKTMAVDPVMTGVAKGWLSGELGRSLNE
jgi:hypothetical protein